jgi:hypothetical protein
MKNLRKFFKHLHPITVNHYIGLTSLERFNPNLIKSPDFQRILNNDKVEEIEEHIKHNPLFPTIVLEIGYLYSEFYLIDGQHRLTALKNTNLINFIFEIHLTIVNTNEELKNLFKLINQNTQIPDDWLLINNMNDVKTNMTDIFNSDLFSQIIKISNKPHRPHLSRPQLDNMITDLYTNNIIIKLEHFEKLNNIYKDYSFENFPNTTGKTNEELWKTCESKKCYLGMMIVKYNYETLKDDLVKVYENDKPNKTSYSSKKQSISKTIKTACWEKYLKDTEQETYQVKCPVKICNNIINPMTFQCGHIISEKHNGKLELNNLRPICSSCNGSMGIQNWNKFEKNM